VPLILRGPGIPAGVRLGVTARGIDLFPTLIDFAGVTMANTRLSGRNLAGAIRGRQQLAEEPSFSESLIPLLHYGWSDLRTVRDGRWKYILAPRPELYDLERDPAEVINLVDTEPARARALRGGLERQLSSEQRAAAMPSNAAAVPPDLLEKLGALGYVSAGGPPDRAVAAGADPKDKIDEYKELNRLVRDGLMRLRTKDYTGSVDRFRALLARGVDSFEAHYYLGRGLLAQKKWSQAAPHFERAIDRLPAFTQAYLSLAECRTAAGDLKSAVAALERGEAQTPANPVLYEREAEIWRRLGNRDKAIHAYERELTLVADDALVRVRLGELYRDAGNTDRAAALLREAVRLDPARASYWNSLGMVLGGRGELPAAESAFREAVSRDPSDAQYAYNLGLALDRQGRSTDAIPFFRRALQLEPRFTAARQRLADAHAR
jgi:tetratricopeptide (TPR) repeat protein